MSSLSVATPLPVGLAGGESAFARVLLGIDFGSASLAAARWATTYVAPRVHAILVHVLPFPDDVSRETDDDAESGGLLSRTSPALTGGLGGFAATLDVARWRSVLRAGRPSRWLSVIANAAEASLVVLGRRGDANRTRIGEPNVIERTARRTSASVLVVPEGTTQAPSHIIAAVDDSVFAPRVLSVSRQLAAIHDLPLSVLHVLSPAIGAYERVIRGARRMVRGAPRAKGPALVRVPSTVPAPTARWLVELSQSRDNDRCDRVEVAIGDPAREVIATAQSTNGALVVVGMRGADEAPAGSVGSVARELLTRAPVPVLAVNGN